MDSKKMPPCNGGTDQTQLDGPNFTSLAAPRKGRRRLPPFVNQLRPGLLEVAVPYGWPKAKVEGSSFEGRTVVLPVGADPAEFDWRFLSGKYVFLFAQPGVGKVIPESVVRAAFREFGLAGAKAVCCWTGKRVIFSTGMVAKEVA